MTPTQKKINGWAIINRQGNLTNKQAEHYQYFIFREKNPAEYLKWSWNKECSEKKYKVVPCTVIINIKKRK